MTDARSQAVGRVDITSIDALTAALIAAVCGPNGSGAQQVVWSDRGSQLLLHVDSLQVRLVNTMLVVAIDTETVEFGKAPLIVRFIFGTDKDPAALVASTDETAHGHPVIAARWGELFRSVVWAAVVRLSVAQATKGGLQPRSISLREDHIAFGSDEPVSVRQLADEHRRARLASAPPGSGDGMS